MKKFGVIGCGNMGQALVRGIYKSFPEVEFVCYNRGIEKAKELAAAVNGRFVEKIEDLLECDVVMLGIKPQHLADFSKENGDLFKNQTIISLLTAVNRERLVRSLGTDQVVRLMPNTPSRVGAGVLLFSFPDNCKLQNDITKLFTACGLVEVVTEEQLDQLTVFSGSGPAYVFQFALYLRDIMTKQGVNSDQARRIVNQLFLGSASLMKDSDEELATMIDQVTSKGGVTIEAVRVFKEQGFSEYFDRALHAAEQRNQELAAEINSLK